MTLVAIFRYESNSLNDWVHIESLESVKHIVHRQIASALSVKNITKRQDTKLIY